MNVLEVGPNLGAALTVVGVAWAFAAMVIADRWFDNRKDRNDG